MFDTIIAVDWSARSSPSPVKPVKDAIYLCIFRLCEGECRHPEYYRTRFSLMARIYEVLEVELSLGRRTLIGFDFNLGYPIGFAKQLTGEVFGLAVWRWISERLEDNIENKNNRFEVAAQVNAMFPGVGPFWGAPHNVRYDQLPQKGTDRFGHGMREFRETEIVSKTAQSAWKLFTTGSVGSQALLGIHHLFRLKSWLGQRSVVFPLETGHTIPEHAVIIGEIYPSYYKFDYAFPLLEKYPEAHYHVEDARQVRQVCDYFATLITDEKKLKVLFPDSGVKKNILTEEGWIFGVQRSGNKK